MRRGREQAQPSGLQCRQLEREHWHPEQRPGGGANHFRVEDIYRAGGEHDCIGAGGLARTDDGASVAGVGQSIAHQHEGRVRRQFAGPLMHDGKHRLRRLRTRDALDHVRRQREDVTNARHRLRIGRDVLALNLPASGNCLCDEAGTFDDEDTFLRTRTAAPQEAPQPLNLWIREGEPFRASSAQSAAFAD